MNDWIVTDLSSLHYPSIDLTIQQILQVGQGAQLSKLDIKEAYHIILAHPEDWPMLDVYWKGNYYIDTCLPFSLRLAPKLFTILADAAQWLIKEAGVERVIHYPDVYFFVEVPHMPEKALRIAIKTLSELSIPVAPERVEGPSTKLTFLGIQLDSDSITTKLLEDKLEELKGTVTAWQDQKACTTREQLPQVGVFQHATMVHYSGLFLLRMIELPKHTREYDHFVCLY